MIAVVNHASCDLNYMLSIFHSMHIGIYKKNVVLDFSCLVRMKVPKCISPCFMMFELLYLWH